jgi:hypothetical protein
MIDLLQTLFTWAAWAVAAASVLGMTAVPLSLFIEDRMRRGKLKKEKL